MNVGDVAGQRLVGLQFRHTSQQLGTLLIPRAPAIRQTAPVAQVHREQAARRHDPFDLAETGRDAPLAPFSRDAIRALGAAAFVKDPFYLIPVSIQALLPVRMLLVPGVVAAGGYPKENTPESQKHVYCH